MTSVRLGYGLARIVEPDSEILPGRICDIGDVVYLAGGQRREGSVTGVRALLLAMLDDAIRCYLSPKAKLRIEAERWVEGHSLDVPVPFEWVCASFGLDAGAARQALRALRRAAVAPEQVRRVRPNVRHDARVAVRRRRHGEVDPGRRGPRAEREPAARPPEGAPKVRELADMGAVAVVEVDDPSTTPSNQTEKDGSLPLKYD